MEQGVSVSPSVCLSVCQSCQGYQGKGLMEPSNPKFEKLQNRGMRSGNFYFQGCALLRRESILGGRLIPLCKLWHNNRTLDKKWYFKKLMSAIFVYLTKRKPLKKLWKMLFSSPNILFWFLRCPNFCSFLPFWANF